MKIFWTNLSKQKFMHFATAIILLIYAIVIVFNLVFISTHSKIMGVEVTERLIADNNEDIRTAVNMVLLYFFSRNAFSNDHLDHDKV